MVLLNYSYFYCFLATAHVLLYCDKVGYGKGYLSTNWSLNLFISVKFVMECMFVLVLIKNLEFGLFDDVIF